MSERHDDYDDGDDNNEMDLADGSVMAGGGARIKSKQNVGVANLLWH